MVGGATVSCDDHVICYSLLTKAVASLLHAVMNAEIKLTFHKVNVHAAMTPSDILGHLQPVFDQARSLKESYKERAGKTSPNKVPVVTVSQHLPSHSFCCDMTIDSTHFVSDHSFL